MKKNIIALVFCYLVFNWSCHAEVRAIKDLKFLEENISCDQDTLVLLDIGGTLLKPVDTLVHKKHRDWLLKWCHENDVHKGEIKQLIRKLQENPNVWTLSDQSWKRIIPKIKATGAKVIAFTKAVIDPTGKYERGNKLRSFGLSIDNEFPGFSSGALYTYKDGVIETERPLKGPVLKEVLSYLTDQPKTIIFIDDQIEQIQSVNEVCEDLGINCIALHYVTNKHAQLLDEEIANLQMKALVDNYQWISDKEAQEIIKHSKQGKTIMSNVEKVKRIVQGMLSGDDSCFKELISEDLVISSPVINLIQMQSSPSETLVEVLGYWKRAFPGVQSQWASVNEDENGNVIVNWEANAAHTGTEFLGIPPKGTSLEYNGRTTYGFSGDKLVRYAAEVDLEKIKRQLNRSSE